MRVVALEIREIELPLVQPFVTSAGRVEVRRTLLVEAFDEEGRSGWSECVALERPDYLPETVDGAWIALGDWLAPRLLGAPLASAADAAALLRRGVRGHEMARAALEMVCWELEAQRRELPLARLLGGVRDRVATGVVVGLGDDVEATVAVVRSAVAAGYRRIKLKVRRGFDLEPATAVAEMLCAEAPGVGLALDANSAYTLADADHLARFDALGLQMIEQPLAWDDLAEHAELQRRLTTPICLDESVRGVRAAERMLELGAGRVLNLKPGRVGGLFAARRIHDLCRAAGVAVWCGGMLESGVGRAYNVALASLPGFVLPGDLSPSARYWERDVVVPEWTMSAEGTVAVPLGRPGLGVEVDRDRVDELTTRRARFGEPVH